MLVRKSDRAVPPADLTCHLIREGEPELALLSFTPRPHPQLTTAEQDVALLILRGLSNESIARARGTSVRTVANQVAAIFDKTGVASRTELAARLSLSDLF